MTSPEPQARDVYAPPVYGYWSSALSHGRELKPSGDSRVVPRPATPEVALPSGATDPAPPEPAIPLQPLGSARRAWWDSLLARTTQRGRGTD